jgi:type IV fimbrial biogenesis protein FimT
MCHFAVGLVMLKLQKGFTLIELMVTLAVLAVAVGIAAPSFKSQVLNNRSVTLGSDLVTALNFARVEAVKRGARVSICPSTDGATCIGGTQWAKGWMVFVDGAVSDGAAVVVTTPLRHWNDLDSKAVVTAKKGAAAIDFARFTGVGMLARTNGADADPRVFTAYITGCKGSMSSTITLGLAGMLNSTKNACL